MVIDSILVSHFVDPDLKVKTFFEKDGIAENGGVDFEIGDIGTFAHLYWRLKKISCRAYLLSCVLGDKKQFLKGLLTCTFIPPLSNSESGKRYKLKLLLMCLEVVNVSSNVVPEDLNIKFRSKFNHGFTNRGCLQCAMWYSKSLQGKRYVQNKIFKILKMFKYTMHFTRAAC